MKTTGLNFIEQKGDVTFYSDSKGDLFQKLNDSSEPFKLKNGSMLYKHITSKNGCAIKYNTNGVHGYSIFNKRGKLMEDNIWELQEAQKVAQTLV